MKEGGNHCGFLLIYNVMNIKDIKFRRLYSFNPYKKLRISLGEMTFIKDFSDTERGDMYPVFDKSDNTLENFDMNYSVSSTEKNAYVKRVLGRFMPNSEYCISVNEIHNAEAGIFVFCENNHDNCFSVGVKEDNGYSFSLKIRGETKNIKADVPSNCDGFSFNISSSGTDIFAHCGDKIIYIYSFEYELDFNICEFPFNYTAALDIKVCENGIFKTNKVEWYIDNGVAFADMKPIRYINGKVLKNNGRIFFTMSSRVHTGGYQSVISWLPGTADFKLEGVIFFEHGDGYITGDIASSVLYDENNKEYLIWMCSFSHGHILGHGKTDCDLLHGINIVEIENMKISENSGDEEFLAEEGDEDPDFYYNEKENKWYLAICRVLPFGDRNSFSYLRFVSDNPFYDYKFLDRTGGFGETGGMFVNIDSHKYFVCGADFDSVSKYRAYDGDDMKFLSELSFDYPDGGFRGWGTLINHKCGNKDMLYLITFDRKLYGKSNWSYGNLCVFEAYL